MVVVLVTIGVPVIVAFVYQTAKRIQNQIVMLTRKNKELRREKKKSDSVLYQVLFLHMTPNAETFSCSVNIFLE